MFELWLCLYSVKGVKLVLILELLFLGKSYVLVSVRMLVLKRFILYLILLLCFLRDCMFKRYIVINVLLFSIFCLLEGIIFFIFVGFKCFNFLYLLCILEFVLICLLFILLRMCSFWSEVDWFKVIYICL